MAHQVTWIDENNYEHKGYGEWMGTWDDDKQKYTDINQENIDFAKQTVSMILDKWASHTALYAIEPVNEPWGNSDMSVLK